MGNFGSRILGNAVSGLRAQQALIATAGNNIANVNTPGYSRRVASLETRDSASVSSGISIGSGVQLAEVVRVADQYLEKVLREATGDRDNEQIKNDFLGRIESLFSLSGDQNTIGSSLTAFFTAINDLSANPASYELRLNMMERGQDVVSTIKDTYNTLASLQDETDDRISDEINVINSLTEQVADLNSRVSAIEGNGAGVEAADERDRREAVLQQLAEKISFNRIELADGTVTISLSNGFPLVVGGISRELEVTENPSFATTVPPSLSGGALSYIVFDYASGSGTSHVDLTQVIQNGTGSVAGLLGIRGYADPANTTPFEATGTLPAIASRVEGITRALLTVFNETYLGPDRDSGTPAFHDPSSGDLNGNAPAVFGFFDFNYGGTKDTGGSPDGLPTATDLDTITAAAGVYNYSSILQLTLSDPNSIAAGLDTSGNTSGALQIAPGDGRNLISLSALQTTQMTLAAGGSGVFSINATLDDGYKNIVSFVGNEKASSDISLRAASDNYQNAQTRRDSVSAVSLDEEFTGLITSQKAYEASARMIRIADELLTQLLQVI